MSHQNVTVREHFQNKCKVVLGFSKQKKQRVLMSFISFLRVGYTYLGLII